MARGDFTPIAPQLTASFANESAAYLDDIYTSYVHSPVITVTARYSF